MSVTARKSSSQSDSLDIGLERGDRKKLAELLGTALANTYVLYAKVQGFHWNVTGPMFYGVHKSTEEQYEDLADRERRRAAMEADPAWSAYRQMVIKADCLLDMQNEIVRPVPFFKGHGASRS